MRDIIVGAANLAVLRALRDALSDVETFRGLCQLHLDLVQAEDAAGALSERTFSLYDLSIVPMQDQERNHLVATTLFNATISAAYHNYSIYQWLPPDYAILKAIMDGERRLLDSATEHEDALAILGRLIVMLEEFLEAVLAYDRAMQ